VVPQHLQQEHHAKTEQRLTEDQISPVENLVRLKASEGLSEGRHGLLIGMGRKNQRWPLTEALRAFGAHSGLCLNVGLSWGRLAERF